MAQRSFSRSASVGKKSSIVIVMIILILLGALSRFGWETPFKDKDGNAIKLAGAPQIRFGIDIRGGVEAVFAPLNYQGKITEEQINSAAKVLNFRLDQLQILDREVTPSVSSGRIIVRFPWKSTETRFDPDQALKELGDMAYLSFVGPDNVEIMNGQDVVRAQAVYDQHRSQPLVSLKFSADGAKKFAVATEKFLGQVISIQLDKQTISRATVQAVISDGASVIEGNFTRESAHDLASKINGGALPFAMTAISSSTISPSLGQNSLDIMLKAGILAFILICIFMLVYYRLPGFVGIISLSAQVIGIMLAISIPQQTLTLQGIAGIILSIGMGVDANIILAERIKEEANRSASLPSILKTAYARAFSSVMDGNVTVAIAAVTLMIFGSGTVLSFGYSLLVGVILNGLTGVYLTRVLISSLAAFKGLQNLKLYGRSGKGSDDSKPVLEKRRIGFTAKRNFIIILSVILLVSGFVGSLMRGINLSIEFKGGSLVRYSYVGEINPEQAASAASKGLGMTVNCHISKSLSDGSSHLEASVAGNEALSPEQLTKLTESIKAEYPDAKCEISSSDLVNPAIGREMLRNGLLALLIASVLIILYVWFSFRSMTGPSAGVFALIALLHDILLASFSFILIGGEINETLIAVILTILGFSINNTIVIYDRIRENIRLYRNDLTLDQVVDLSITQSLSRSINTSLAIFVAVLIALVFAVTNDLSSIVEFAVPILVGTVGGTFSSICLTSPFWAKWKTRNNASGYGS